MAWQLRIRSEKGKVDVLNLESGADTSLRALKQEINKASKIPQYKQVWRAGFPPRVVFSPLTKLPATAKVSSVVSDRDFIVLEAATAAELAAAVAKASAPDPADPAEPDSLATASTGLAATPACGTDPSAASRPVAGGVSSPASPNRDATHGAGASRAMQQSTPVRTAGGAAGTSAPMLSASPQSGQRAKAKKRKNMEFPGLGLSLSGSVENADTAAPKDAAEAVQRTEDSIAAALLAAARGGAQVGDAFGLDWTPGNKNLFKGLRGDLKDARRARGQEAEALIKVSAARAGQATFKDLVDGTGRVEVSWPSGRKTLRECVPSIPPLLLVAVLVSLYHDADEVVAQNLDPSNMAQVSTRTFWALVRHGGVGESVTFEQALQKLVPNLDWAKLRVGGRQRKVPDKLQDHHAT